MKKIANCIFIFTLVTLFAVCPFKSASAQVGGYVGVWGGYTISPDASSNDWNYYNSDLYLDVKETPVLGVKVGYTPPLLKYLAFEFEYSYLNPDITDYVDVDGNVKFNNFMFNAIAKYPQGRFHPYVGAGIGFSYTDVSINANRWISGEDYTSFAWQLLTGVEIDIANNLAVDIGYHYFATELDFEYDTKVDFTTSMITLGLKFLF